jgi:structure-specific endonuclease subunit SLX1
VADESEFLPPSPNQASSTNSKTRKLTNGHGISALSINYELHKPHVEKSKAIVDFEREGSCSICDQDLGHDGGIYALCPHLGCESVNHLICLSNSFLQAEFRGKNCRRESSNVDEEQAILPLDGKCKDCGGTVKWVDIVKEVTLRMRGAKEVDRLLKEPKKKAPKDPSPRKRNPKGAGSVASAPTASDIDEEPDEVEDLDAARDGTRFSTSDPESHEKDEWLVISDSDDDDTQSRTSAWNVSPDRYGHTLGKALDPVVEDSDWEDALLLD